MLSKKAAEIRLRHDAHLFANGRNGLTALKQLLCAMNPRLSEVLVQRHLAMLAKHAVEKIRAVPGQLCHAIQAKILFDMLVNVVANGVDNLLMRTGQLDLRPVTDRFKEQKRDRRFQKSPLHVGISLLRAAVPDIRNQARHMRRRELKLRVVPLSIRVKAP